MVFDRSHCCFIIGAATAPAAAAPIAAPAAATILLLLEQLQAGATIGAATARVAQVQTLPTFILLLLLYFIGILTWEAGTHPKLFCSKVLIHYTMDPTIFSTLAAPWVQPQLSGQYYTWRHM